MADVQTTVMFRYNAATYAHYNVIQMHSIISPTASVTFETHCRDISVSLDVQNIFHSFF